MKKVIVLVTCLLSGLMAAAVGGGIDEAEVQRVTTEISRVTGEIAGNQGMIDRAGKDAEFNKFLTSKNPDHLEIRKKKIEDFKVELKGLEEQLDKLLR